MLSILFIALFQSAAGDPAAAPVETTTEAAPAPAPASHTERRRVCLTDTVATGGRIARRRCHWEDVQVEEPAQTDADTAAREAPPSAGSLSPAAAPTAPR